MRTVMTLGPPQSGDHPVPRTNHPAGSARLVSWERLRGRHRLERREPPSEAQCRAADHDGLETARSSPLEADKRAAQ